jgi:hypothetical protein
MNSKTWYAVAILALLGAIYLLNIAYSTPGTQLWQAIVGSLLAGLTVRSTIAAAKASLREKQSRH